VDGSEAHLEDAKPASRLTMILHEIGNQCCKIRGRFPHQTETLDVNWPAGGQRRPASKSAYAGSKRAVPPGEDAVPPRIR